MAAMLIGRAFKSVRNSSNLAVRARSLCMTSAARQPDSDTQPSESSSSSSFTFEKENEKPVLVKAPNTRRNNDSDSVTMLTSFMTGSIVGKRFYKKVTTREADDGNRWTVMLDYRTLKAPSKRPLKLRSLALAKAIAAEWEYQLTEGIRPFTMPLMRLACTALERVPLTRSMIIEHLARKLHQDLVFFRAPEDKYYTSDVHEIQVEKLVKAVEDLLKKTNDGELASIDALQASAHSIVIALGIFCGKLQIDDAIKLILLEEDLQVSFCHSPANIYCFGILCILNFSKSFIS
ncbi:PREDICTED: uncharacterized protein LOC104770751 [Camelina sativa]|uniref:Uncharacterized protein LOC104770751 n=1 Tax=Camelina sativa TaxID=90675 RepID=A0ABM0Y075_CAMSA|nr:PREDICTED: uncharacterized protein LOC104770751 [Camelina sativa]